MEREQSDRVEQSANDDDKGGEAAVADRDTAFRYWYVWNISMGADNVMAHVRQVLDNNDVTVGSVSGGILSATGADGQAVLIWVKLIGAGPRSLLTLNISDRAGAHALSLRDAIRSELTTRLGL